MKRIVIISICLTLVILAFGQTLNKKNDDVRLAPRLMNYQGFITDTLGNPITNPTVSITFGIWSTSAGGTQFWFETQVISITKGIFNATLGTTAPIPDTVFTKSAERWMELTVAGITLSPRTRIVAVSYAYTATHSDTAEYAKAAPVTGAAGGDLTGNYPNPLIAPGKVTTSKIADTAITMPKIAQAGATAGQVIKWSGTAWQPGVDSSMDNDWSYLISDAADTTLQMGGRWGIARFGNTMYGNADSTHVNLGVGGTTGTNGQNNKYCTVSGGIGNAASWDGATVGGGRYNTASNALATVAGGNGNYATGNTATVGGGQSNVSSNDYTTVSGGVGNTASGYISTVGGGGVNTANGYGATVGGGVYNANAGAYSAILGGYADTIASGAAYSYLFGINSNLTQDSTFMVDLLHVWFGTEANGYEFPYGRGTDGQVMKLNGSGLLSWGSITYVDSARIAANAYKLQGKDTVNFNLDYVNEGQANSIDSLMLQNSAVTMPKIAPAGATTGQVIKWNGTTWQPSADSSMDNDWNFQITDGADTTLQMGGRWGIARYGNMMYGNADSTHVNFGVACTTGANGANFKYCTVSGGVNNTASYDFSTVGGGQGNTARSNQGATVAGGMFNIAGHYCTTVGGGYNNTASGGYATVSGGSSNTASNDAAMVGSGYGNTASGLYSFVGAGTANIVSGGVSFIGGGYTNRASGWCTTVGGGYGTVASASLASVVGGAYNHADGSYSFVGGGWWNWALDSFNIIGGGYMNTNAGMYSAILGGYADTITTSGAYSYLFGINSNLTQDSTFMVDMPHVWFGTEGNGYEFPYGRGLDGQVMVTNGSGLLSWGSIAYVDSARVAANAHKLQGKDTTDFNDDFVNEGQVNSIDSLMLRNNSVTMPKISQAGATAGQVIKWNGSAWQPSADSSMDNDWNFQITDGADTTLQMGGRWGIARYGNTLYGNADSTHVNLGVVSTTGTNGQDIKYSTVGGGLNNTASGYGATVSGGVGNLADYGATVGGGGSNTASGNAATVSGGGGNIASGYAATVGGGAYNTTSGYGATVSGGGGNIASGYGVTVAGGGNNTASGYIATVGGGQYNANAGDYSAILGGYADTITAGGAYSYLFGINSNLTQDSTFMVDMPHIRFGTETAGYEFPATDGTNGQVMKLNGSGLLSWGSITYVDSARIAANAYKLQGKDTVNFNLDYVNEGQVNSITNAMIQDAAVTMPKIAQTGATAGQVIKWSGTAWQPGVDSSMDSDWSFLISDGADTTLQMGGQWGIARAGNTMYGNADSTHVNFGIACTTGISGGNFKYSTIAGGLYNSANNRSTVAGGESNHARGEYATIGGGLNNTADGNYTFIGGGINNNAIFPYATICGGTNNTVNYYYGVVAGGSSNTASNAAAMVGAGYGNTSSGVYSFVGAGEGNIGSGYCSFLGGGEANTASGWCTTVGGGYGTVASASLASVVGGAHNHADGSYSFVGGGWWNYTLDSFNIIGGGYMNTNAGMYSAILGGYADTIMTGANYSYLFGINSNLTQDSTFMVDLPHIRFGTEAAGYEFPTTDGTNGQALVTNGSGQVSWGTPTDAGLTISGNDMYSAVSGNFGVGASTPTAKLDVAGTAGYDQFRMRTTYTPTGSADANGNVGDVAWDDGYVYVKTSTGWKRSTLSTW